MKTIIHFIISALAILITAYLLPGVHVTGIFAALVLAVVLGIINTFLRPLLILLTLPLTVFTLGLSILFINGFLVVLATHIVPGFTVASYWSAFLFAIVLAFVNAVLNMFEGERN